MRSRVTVIETRDELAPIGARILPEGGHNEWILEMSTSAAIDLATKLLARAKLVMSRRLLRSQSWGSNYGKAAK
jgi:hypothetical protein